MYLDYRPLETADIESCLPWVSADYAEHPEIRPLAPEIWRHLLALGSLNGMVLEDRALPPSQRLAAFGMSVFVTPKFMESAKRGAVPGVAAQVVKQILAGESTLLGPDAVRQANSGPGLHLLVLHYKEILNPSNPERVQAIRDKQVETFFFVHGGYQFAEMLVEHRDDCLRQFALECGFRVRSKYGDYYRDHPRPDCGSPTLLGITREEALPHPGLHVSRLFLYTPPRFYFKPREQALLWRALRDETDEEIANALKLSVAALKKRWAGLYERVADTDCSLFPTLPRDGEARRGQEKRGQEKRRHLLRYLRQHPEELRPVDKPE